MSWPPARLGSYEVLRQIGEGGMATAFLGRSPQGRHVVLKVPLDANADMAIKLRDEAQAGFRVRHPHVVETLDFLLDKGRPVLVIEYVDGCALRDLRQVGGQPNPLPPAAVAWLGRSLAEGLAAIHEATDEDGRSLHMLHRDVTPSNILIGTDGQPKLIDLGIASSVENQQERTQIGMLKGTLRYVAPELLAGEKFDVATDLWSLGVCLLEAALGRQMVSGDPVAIFRALTGGSYRTLRPGESLEPDLAAAIFALVTDKHTRLRNARAAAAVFGRLELKLVAADPHHYSGQAWLQSWVPHAPTNASDEDGPVVEGPAPTAHGAARVATVVGAVEVVTEDANVDNEDDVFAASVSAAASASTPQVVRTVIGDTSFGSTPTLMLPVAQVAPLSPVSQPARGSTDPAVTLMLPSVDVAGGLVAVHTEPVASSSALPGPVRSAAGIGPTLVLPRVDLRSSSVTGPTVQMPAIHHAAMHGAGPTEQMPAVSLTGPVRAARPRLVDDEAPLVPATGDVLPAGASTVQMAAWTPPGADEPTPQAWAEDARESAIPRAQAVASSSSSVPGVPTSDVAKATVRTPVAVVARQPTVAEAAATLVMEAVTIPPRPTAAEAAATVVMEAVDIVAPEPGKT
jgi:serine/threonine-protein kinase